MSEDFTEQEKTKQWERTQVPEGYIKVRQYLGNGKYAVRYRPAGDKLRVDEEIVECQRK